MTEPVGSVAEEAAKLLEALEGWARGAASGATHAVHDNVATGSAECRLCPVCQLIGLLKSARPEVYEHLLLAAGSLLSALRAVVDAHEGSWASGRGAPVERIDVT